MILAETINDLGRSIVPQPDFRRPFFQPLWSRLLRLALWRMNIGPAGSLADRGGKWVLEWCASQAGDSRDFVIFDAGANVGTYAADTLKLVEKRAQIHCSEPSPPAFAKLEATFNNQSQVRLLPFDLSSENCQSQLSSHAGGCAEASLMKRDMSRWGIEQDIVEAVLLRQPDGYCAEAEIERIDFLKLDVERHELEALREAARMINEKRIRFIQFEFGAPDIESRTFFKDIFHVLQPHYKIYRIVYQGLSPIDSYSEFHETFATTNFLAELR